MAKHAEGLLANDLMLKYAISEDGRLHSEMFYRTVTEEYAPRFVGATSRPSPESPRVPTATASMMRRAFRPMATKRPADCSVSIHEAVTVNHFEGDALRSVALFFWLVFPQPQLLRQRISNRIKSAEEST